MYNSGLLPIIYVVFTYFTRMLMATIAAYTVWRFYTNPFLTLQVWVVYFLVLNLMSIEADIDDGMARAARKMLYVITCVAFALSVVFVPLGVFDENLCPLSTEVNSSLRSYCSR